MPLLLLRRDKSTDYELSKRILLKIERFFQDIFKLQETGSLQKKSALTVNLKRVTVSAAIT